MLCDRLLRAAQLYGPLDWKLAHQFSCRIKTFTPILFFLF